MMWCVSSSRLKQYKLHAGTSNQQFQDFMVANSYPMGFKQAASIAKNKSGLWKWIWQIKKDGKTRMSRAVGCSRWKSQYVGSATKDTLADMVASWNSSALVADYPSQRFTVQFGE